MREWLGIVCLLVFAAQTDRAQAEQRVALIIGNSAYQHTSFLPNPRNDAGDLSIALQRHGFQVVTGVDLGKRQMEAAIREFTAKIDQTETALFFYAGHALQVGKQNFLLPIDARLAKEADVDWETVPLTLILRHMQAQAKTSLIFLDACRDNPLARTLARTVPTRSSFFGRGLAAVEAAGIDTMVGFSTQPDNVAMDGSGRNSPYAAALLTHMATGLEIGQVMMLVRRDVFESTKQNQVPWEHSSLTRPFYFVRTAAPEPVRPTLSSPSEVQTAVRPTLKGSVPGAAAAPPSKGPPDLTSRLLNWIEREYLHDRVTFAPTVDWYDKGALSRDAVLQDRAKYIAAWPERRFTYIPGTLQVAESAPNRYTATFSVSYWVRNTSGQERSGHSHISVDLLVSGSQLAIARQQEIVQRQR